MNIRVSVCESEAAEASNVFFPFFFKKHLTIIASGETNELIYLNDVVQILNLRTLLLLLFSSNNLVFSCCI